MSTITLSYGKKQVSFDIADSQTVEIIMPPAPLPTGNETRIVSDSINNPVGSFNWESVSPHGSVAIAINDKTRPVPNNILVPILLDKLTSLGFHPEQIKFFIATGTHTPMPGEEFGMLLPAEIIDRYQVVSHDCDAEEDLCFLGVTTRHTEVWINKAFYLSNIKIVIGNIEPHHFMGYSGGAKTAAIGLSGRWTINKNHAMLVEPEATFGVYESNPTRQDVEEIGDLIRIDAALNVVMNPARQIMHSIFGSPREAMAIGIPYSQQICQTKIKKADFDLVIASPGGYPKDINLYQSQKALSHAASITRDGGCVILVAECVEGVGSNSYEAFMKGVTSTEAVFSKLQEEGFKVGPHKALQFAREQKRINIIVVSNIDDNRLRNLLLEPASSILEAYQKACAQLPHLYRIAVMPKATNTIPFIE